MGRKRYLVKMTPERWDALCSRAEDLIAKHEGSIEYAAAACGFSSRRLYDVRMRKAKFLELTTIERILLAIEDDHWSLDIFMPVPGKDGWSKMGHRFCEDCGDYERKHHAKGLCYSCYSYQLNNPGKLRSYQAK